MEPARPAPLHPQNENAVAETGMPAIVDLHILADMGRMNG
jgi:hypothetical protein